MLLLCSLASAHVGATITGVDVEPGDQGLMLEANFGLLLPDEDGAWRWTCHETVTAEGVILTPRYARLPDDTLLVTITAMQGIEAEHSLYRSTDGGCSWENAGLEDQLISVLDTSGEAALIGTGNLGEGAQNDLLRSTDSGATWEPAGLELGERIVLSVVGSGQLAWATTVDLDDWSASLWSSADAGQSWTEQALDLDLQDQDLQRLLVVHGTEDQVWLIVSTLGPDRVLHVGPEGADFLHEVEGDLIDGAVTEDGVFWLVEGSKRVWRSEDGLAFEEAEVPVSIGVGADQDAWLTGYADFTGGLLFREDELRLAPHEIAGPLQCPEDSPSVQVCDPLWPELWSRLEVFTPSDTGEPGSGTGQPGTNPPEDGPARSPEPRHGCGTPLAPSALATLLAVLLSRRRRC